MSVTVRAVNGPLDADYVHLLGTHDAMPTIARTKAILRAAIAAGDLTIPAERDALVAEVEAAYAAYVASQEQLEDL